MADALIGHSGFVGGTLQRQARFDELYRSTNIAEIRGREFGVVVCAGARAQKWIANREPEADRAHIDGLIADLATIRCKTFVLVSTVDVFREPIAVDEGTPIDESGLHPYGLNRRRLEAFVERHFARRVIVRLPGLVGPGLRKNVIYDFLNDNNVAAVDSRGVFQFYPTVNLWSDIRTAIDAGLDLVHLTAAPLSVANVSELGFGRPFSNVTANVPARYDLRTRHAKAFGGEGHYQYEARDSLMAIRYYAQSEPRSGK
jgi:nucleoside-diphosphate-sugar epimerase